jgi:plastocyanin
VDDAGAPVTTLKAGTYQVKIKDTSKIHNFHLSGPGGIDLETTVPEVTETTWPVTLTAGTYTFECDPHPQTMKKTFTVT